MSEVAPDTTTVPTYESACARIEEIIRRLDSGEAGLRETLELCKEGRRLVE
jgi:exodeoxyribonuclease VII small subunit